MGMPEQFALFRKSGSCHNNFCYFYVDEAWTLQYKSNFFALLI